MMPSASAGSNHLAASDSLAAIVSWPSGPAVAVSAMRSATHVRNRTRACMAVLPRWRGCKRSPSLGWGARLVKRFGCDDAGALAGAGLSLALSLGVAYTVVTVFYV